MLFLFLFFQLSDKMLKRLNVGSKLANRYSGTLLSFHRIIHCYFIEFATWWITCENSIKISKHKSRTIFKITLLLKRFKASARKTVSCLDKRQSIKVIQLQNETICIL